MEAGVFFMNLSHAEMEELTRQANAQAEAFFGHGAKAVAPGTARGFWDALDDLAKKANVSCGMVIAPDMERFFPGSMHAKMPYVMGQVYNIPRAGSIVVARNLLDRAGISEHAPPPAWLKSIFAHEMGHINHGITPIAQARKWPVIFPVAAVAGTYLYEKFLANHDEKDLSTVDNKEKTRQFEAFADQQIARQQEKEKQAEQGDVRAMLGTSRGNHSTSLQAGKYLIAAILGVGAGMLATRSHMRSLEFQADRFAVKMMGSAQPVEEGIRTLSRIIEEAQRDLPKGQHKQSLKNIYTVLVEHAHPALEERIQAIRAAGKSFGFDKIPSGASHAATLLAEGRNAESVITGGTLHL